VAIHPRSPSPRQPETEADPSLAELRDRILGPPRPGEDLESYRLRAYQARGQAAELLADGSAPDPGQNPIPENDPSVNQESLAAISETLSGADRSWSEVTTPPQP